MFGRATIRLGIGPHSSMIMIMIMYRQPEKLLNSNVSSICSHNMVNFNPLVAEMDWRVWGTPADVNGFRILASLLQRHRSTVVNQTLHDVWPSPGL